MPVPSRTRSLRRARFARVPLARGLARLLGTLLAAWVVRAAGPCWAEPSPDGGPPGDGGPEALPTVEVVADPDPRVAEPEDDGAGVEPAPAAPSTFATRVPVKRADATEGTGRLVSRAPGAQLRQLGGPGQRQELILRGATNAQVIVFLDGIRLSPPQGGGFDLSLVSADHLQAIEVLRGAASARYGSDALGGVIHLHTRSLAEGEAARQLFSLSTGSFGTWRLHADRAARLGGWSTLVSATHLSTAGDFPYVDDNGRGRQRENADARSEALLAKAARRFQAGELALLLDVLWDRRGVAGSAEFPSQTARQDNLRLLVAARGRRDDLGRPGARLTLTASLRAERVLFQDPRPPLLGAGGVIDARTWALVPGADARYELPLGQHLILEAGLEGRLEQLLDAATSSRQRGAFDAFAAAEVFTAGREVVAAPVARVAVLSGFGATLVPALGLLLAPLRRRGPAWLRPLQLRANVGRAYRNPSLYELYITLAGIRGNPALRPEDALAWDAGVAYGAPRVRLEVAYFERRVASSILFLPTSAFLVSAENFRDLTVRGAETALRIGPFGPLQVALRHTFQQARLDEPPAYAVPARPAHLGGGDVTLAGRLGRLGGVAVRGRLRGSVDAQSTFFLDRFNARREEARALVGGLAELTIGRMRFALEGRNLLDKRDAVDALQLPLAPRLLLATLELRP